MFALKFLLMADISCTLHAIQTLVNLFKSTKS